MYQWFKGLAQWRIGRTLYLSVPFTWLLAEAKVLAEAHRGPVYAGGPAVALAGCDWAKTDSEPPVEPLLHHNPSATFTSRGCPRGCAFCAVPRIEGEFRELPSWRHAPVICDNNLLAASRKHFERVMDSLRPFPACDFNQGLDARLLQDWHLDGLRSVRPIKLRFAFDHASQERVVADAIARCRKAGFREFGVYVLVGYNDTPSETVARLETVRAWGIRPNPMRYHPLDATAKDAFVGDGWTDQELRRVMRYYSRLAWLEHIPFADYDPTDDGLPLFEAARN